MDEPPVVPPTPEIVPVTIEEEMSRSYLDYAMSVIVARALPDARDGLKPVHRRILFAMQEGGYTADRAYRKSARIIGDVTGKYHPHGTDPVYEALVRMAQDFSMRLRLVDGQGNFGSMDGDPPAAMRYTEARLARPAQELLADIDRDTVEFRDNYDGSEREPVVLPAKFPNLLVNGAGGIAVGMATSIPTHNLGEVIDACCALIDDPALSIEQIIERHIPGPDFPTGGILLGRNGIREAYHRGRGSLTLRGKTEIEEGREGRRAIVVTEVPYQVNKARMIERMAELVNDKVIEGISDLRDESDRHGLRVVIELKRDAVPEVVLNQLFRHTPLQTTFGVQMLALLGGRPETLNLKQMLEAFLAFREEVIARRTRFDLARAHERAHTLVGLAVAVANLDAVIRLIRGSKDPAEARQGLVSTPWPATEVAPLIRLIDEPGRGVAADGTYRMSEAQARAILELRLHRLTGLERDKIAADLNEVVAEIGGWLAILGDRARLLGVLRDELLEIKTRFADPRRTTLEDLEFEADIEALIPREDMVVTVTHAGYIKRVPVSAYRAQRRGGKGRAGMATREEDFVTGVHVVNTHTPVLFFSSRGMVYRRKVYELPLGTPQGRGRPMTNVLIRRVDGRPKEILEEGETVTTLMPMPEDEASWTDLFVLFATASGGVRRNRMSDFASVMASGKIAMKLDPGDRLVGVAPCAEGSDDVLLATRGGKCIRFQVSDQEVRVFSGRTSTGVRGIKLAEGDAVISMSVLRHVDFDAEERDAYLRRSRAERAEEAPTAEEAGPAPIADERYAALKAAEEFVLTVTARGFGKRSSAYEYRITGRGGQGIVNIELGEGDLAAPAEAAGQQAPGGRAGYAKAGNAVVGSFPVAADDQLMLVTDKGQVIRIRVGEIRIAGRATRGVTLFRTDPDERVVSVARLREEETGARSDADEA